MMIPTLTAAACLEKSVLPLNPFFRDYYAFYSSWFGGITTDPRLMLLPIDDHIVHRGDGVFEAMKAIHRGIYLLDEHLERLIRSAESIALPLPCSSTVLKSIVIETIRVADRSDASIRLFLSRGPGDFSANPYDSVGTQLYIMVMRLKTPAPEKYEHGVSIGISTIPAKPSWMAQIKSCNYLPNVLMKKEAIDRSLDFVIALDEQGHCTESATENLLMVDKRGTLVYPPLHSILKGTTLMRLCALARAEGIPTKERAFSLEELTTARELFIVGTTHNLLPVVRCEQQNIGNGTPGPLAHRLQEMLQHDISSGNRRTPF